VATSEEQSAVLNALSFGSPYPVIVDLGAYQAEEYYWLYPALAPSRYIAVEADPRNAAHIRNKRLPGLQLIECAIADHDGFTWFHQCGNDVDMAINSGSIRRPTGHLQHFPWCTFMRSIEIPCVTLDSLFPRMDIDLIWCDVQGAERDVIAGGLETLKRTRFLFLESELVEFYEGQALRPELLSMLPDWEVIQECECNLFLRNRAYAGSE
jgi:FkbM family methyltransferase